MQPTALPDAMRGYADKSVLEMRNGELYVITSGPLFPSGGGAHCGGWSEAFNLSKHFEEIVRRVVNEKQTVE